MHLIPELFRSGDALDYRITRDGELLGSYSLLQLQRHLESGEVLETDLAQAEGMEQGIPVSELFPAPYPRHSITAGGQRSLYPNPPDLRWWVALLLGIVTLGAFFVVWDVVEAAWLRRVEKANAALFLYSLALVLFVANIPAQISGINYALFNGPPVDAPFSVTLSLIAFGARMVARFVLRDELLRHFSKTEPIGLKLNRLMTLLFSGLYFQYHFNRINERKRALRA